MPHIIFQQCLILLFHHRTPVWDTHSHLIMAGFSSRIRLRVSHTCREPHNRAIGAFTRTNNAALAASVWTQNNRSRRRGRSCRDRRCRRRDRRSRRTRPTRGRRRQPTSSWGRRPPGRRGVRRWREQQCAANSWLLHRRRRRRRAARRRPIRRGWAGGRRRGRAS